MGKESSTAVANAPARSTVSQMGQVVIPANVRKSAGIRAGSDVVFTPLADGRVVMRVKSGTLADLRGVVKTKRHATDAQIRNGKRGTLVRSAKTDPLRGAKPGSVLTTKARDKLVPATNSKK